MSPIPKAPKAKSPIQKAIEAMLEQAAKGTMPLPTSVIVHPKDAAELKPDGPLMKAYRESKQQMANTPLTLGRPQPLTYKQAVSMTYDEAGDSLLRDLEDSLWAMATLHTPVFTQEDLYTKHVGPGHMEDDWYVKRVNGMEVHLLCKCQMILVMQRCMYGVDEPAEFGLWCEEPAFPVEATLRKDTRCGQHKGM